MAGRLLHLLGLLYYLQVVAGVLVYFAFDVQPLALTLSLAFLAAVGWAGWEAGRSMGRAALPLGLTAGALWQLPGLVDTVAGARLALGLSRYDGWNDILDFVAQEWHTALIPLISLLPHFPIRLWDSHWYAQLLASPLLALGLSGAMALGARRGGSRR